MGDKKYTVVLNESQAKNLISLLALTVTGWWALGQKGLIPQDQVTTMEELHKYVWSELNRQLENNPSPE